MKTLALILLTTTALAVEHPYLLWTKDEAAAIRQRIETDPLAKKQFERMMAMDGRDDKAGGNRPWLNLFKYAVLGDAAAGAAEKKALLGFIGARVPGSVGGNPETSNAPWRDDQTLNAVRYDVLYHELTPEQRKGVEDTIRFYVRWLQTTRGPWVKADPGLKNGFARTGWLPNMQWPTVAGIHVLAAVSGDEALIKDTFAAVGGWKWYLDNYIVDGRFYMEEFGKYYSNIGAMLLWCEGLERLGLGQYGYGYTGKGGATMRNFLHMLIYAGYPRLNRGGGTPDYLAVTMGDAGGASIVNGYFADGTGGHTSWWCGGRMNGAIRKMANPLWWEMGHRRFPQDGYDYFLAQMRKPGEEVYLPSLYFGLGPIDPKTVKPPAVKSFVAPERGFALLRAEESPAYWESPKPAVALQFGMYYVHYVHDCFSILQFIANNRTIYDRMGGVGGGYAGGDPWRDHVRGKGSGVVVDGLKTQFVDNGEEGIKNERLRHHFAPTAKFTAIRAKGLYPDVEQERALVLTDEYLFDLFALTSNRPRVYDWHVLTGNAVTDGAWQPATTNQAKPFLTDCQTSDVAGNPWTITLARGDYGVRVWMLGEAGTQLVAGRPPGVGTNSVVTQLIATRTVPATTFVALHEPFVRTTPRLREFARVAQSEAGIVARVVGEAFSDRVMFAYADEPVTLAGDGETFTFTGYGHVRVTAGKVEVTGNVAALKLKVAGNPKLVVNGKDVAGKRGGGWVEFGR